MSTFINITTLREISNQKRYNVHYNSDLQKPHYTSIYYRSISLENAKYINILCIEEKTRIYKHPTTQIFMSLLILFCR